jgi:hypothetical protein
LRLINTGVIHEVKVKLFVSEFLHPVFLPWRVAGRN